MAAHIPFVTGTEGCGLASGIYADSPAIRILLEKAPALIPSLPKKPKVWIDPGVDGLDDIETRRSKPGRQNSWYEFTRTAPHFEKIGSVAFQAEPVKADVNKFVIHMMNLCAAHSPDWISVPQLPASDGTARNKINRLLAAAAGKWKNQTGFEGSLILPVIITHQGQIRGKTDRNPRVNHAVSCYSDANAEGLWVVDKSFSDETGSKTLSAARFPAVVDFHTELNARIDSQIRIGGPYWGLNLALWSRRLIDYPAIGIGSGYQHFLAGGHTTTPTPSLAIPCLRRRIKVGLPLTDWLAESIKAPDVSQQVRAELSGIRKNYNALQGSQPARRQVAEFYKTWCDVVVPGTTSLYTDVSLAWAAGRPLPEIADEGTARRPEAIADSLMKHCF